MKRRIVGLMIAALAFPAVRAAATETQLWVSDSPADYAKAEARGVVIGPEGVLRLGPRASSSPAESLSVIWAIAVLSDGSVALAGDGGRIDRWTEAGGVRPWVRLPAGQVLSLAIDGDGLVAGTGPGGLVYRVTARGDTTLLARTGERYVWGLAPARKGAWYAATGTRGRLLEVAPGRARTILDSDESNLVSLAADGKGGAFAGGDSRGRIFWAHADGSVTTAYDAAEDEIRALAFGPDGALYAAGLTVSATTDEDTEQRPQPVKSAVASARATVYRIVPDNSAASLWTSPHPFVFALAGTREAVIAATGNRAALFALDPAHHASQLLAVPEGQVTALAVDARGRVFAASSNPGALWRFGPDRAARGELLSTALDARRFARFGRITWRGEAGGGRVELMTRSGNADPPDTTWSVWKAPAAEDRVASPPARYLQWMLVLSGGDPSVDAVEVAWREQNLPPRIDELVVAPQGAGFREGDLQPRTEPVTQTLRGGQKVEYSVSPGSTPRELRALPAWARGLRTLQWKASDPNGDALRYRVDLRTEGSDQWTKVDDDLEASSFTWDTNGLPDGRYRIRVQASDTPANPVGEALTAEAVSEPFTVDNTPPAVTSLELRGEPGTIAVSGRAGDGQSILTRLEIAFDDDEWRALSPEGGLADARELAFSLRMPDISPGQHTVAVRAIDLAGNTATRAAQVTVPRPR